MEILGKDFINFKPLIYIKNIEDLTNGALFDYNEDFIKLANKKEFEYSVIVNDIFQALFANAARAKYIVLNKNFKNPKKLTKLAQFYLFDSKISVYCKNEDDFKNAVKNGVDCIIFDKGILWK